MDEFDLIARYFAPLATAPGAFGLKDDAAVNSAAAGLRSRRHHRPDRRRHGFLHARSAGTIAQKGAAGEFVRSRRQGRGAGLLSSQPGVARTAMTRGMAGRISPPGLRQDQANFGISLLGGDTRRRKGRSPSPSPRSALCRRARWSGAAAPGPAMRVYVTGTIGDSGGGLAIFKREKHTLARRSAISDRRAIACRSRRSAFGARIVRALPPRRSMSPTA